MKRTIPALSLLAFVAIARSAEPLPTPAEIQKLFDDKNWSALLSATTRVLALKGPATASFDRADLWMKKGEAQLQSAQFLPASQSFAKAADEKGAAADQVDLALATSRLAKRSDAKGYRTPSKLGPSRTFDVLNPATRPEAMAAMLEVDLIDLRQKIDQNKTTTESRLVLETLKTLADIRPVDRVVNKGVEKTDELEKTISSNFVDTISRWSDSTDVRLDAISAAANETVQQRYTDQNKRVIIREVRRGLTGNDAQEIQGYIQKSQQLAESYKDIQQKMSDTGRGVLKPAENSIQRIYDKAKLIRTDAARPA